MSQLTFQLPDGTSVPAHFHITEIGQVNKKFIDCGGTHRSETVCRLQLWVAKDFWHRFKAEKLLAILNKAEAVLGSDDLQVDIEYDAGVITQAAVERISVVEDELVLKLRPRHTACLAKEEAKAKRGLFRLFRS